MDDKCREALRLTWDVAQREHKMIAKIIPVIGEIADLLSEGRNATDEQIRRWRSLHTQVAKEMIELTVAFESVRQLAPNFGFDA